MNVPDAKKALPALRDEIRALGVTVRVFDEAGKHTAVRVLSEGGMVPLCGPRAANELHAYLEGYRDVLRDLRDERVGAPKE